MSRSWTPLKHRTDFLRIDASGRQRVTPAFILRADAVKPGHAGRIGFTVSRKVGNAVARNRARRRLRAVVDHVTAPGTDSLPEMDFVLIGRGDALTRTFAAMVSDFQHAAARVANAPARPRRQGSNTP